MCRGKIFNFIIEKRKRNKKKTASSTTSSNNDIVQNPSTSRKPDEEAAGNEIEKEQEIRAESMMGAQADDGQLFILSFTLIYYSDAKAWEGSWDGPVYFDYSRRWHTPLSLHPCLEVFHPSCSDYSI